MTEKTKRFVCIGIIAVVGVVLLFVLRPVLTGQGGAGADPLAELREPPPPRPAPGQQFGGGTTSSTGDASGSDGDDGGGG